jgi:hypothetical protein
MERRVLGVLVEKAKTTPDAYPLSLNAVVNGCNQKSNRDPLMNMSEEDADEALTAAQKKGLAIKVTSSGRVVRWRHALYEAWKVDKPQLAILAELLLRGAQTEGELRARASRMEPFADRDALRASLDPLVERGQVIYLSPPERRGALLTHGYCSPQELENLRALESHRPVAAAAPSAQGESGASSAIEELQRRLAAVEAEIAAIKDRLGRTEPPTT